MTGTTGKAVRIVFLFLQSVFYSGFLISGLSFAFTTKQRDGVEVLSVSARSEYYCPKGFSFDLSFHTCVDESHVLGPFSDEMMTRCKMYGGGIPCEGKLWNRDFALKIRGAERCPVGTEWSNDLDVCVSGENAFGPFLVEQHQYCLDVGGGPACETMRWSRRFIESYLKRGGGGTVDGGAQFALPEPNDNEVTKVLSLWATHYRIPTVHDQGDAGIPLRDMTGASLGVSLTRTDWCHAALEGSVRVLNGRDSGIVFNYAGSKQGFWQADCSDVAATSGLAYSCFRRARGRFGDGVSGYLLNPYRTIAVDPSYIPYGSVVYIPAARGRQITLPNGEIVSHDGYFFAADTGGAIDGNHIDVFIGSARENPFKFIRSTPSGLFQAYVIESNSIHNYFEATHTVLMLQ